VTNFGLPLDLGSSATSRRALDALTGNSLIKFAREFSDQPASTLGDVAQHYNFSRAGQALSSGRVDDLLAAAGQDAIGLLAAEGAALVNRRIDAAAGKWGEVAKSFNRSDPAPAGAVMLMLGDVPFMVGTLAHQTLTRTFEYRWAVQERLLRTPARQFIGAGNETLALAGYLLPHYTGGADTLVRLRTLAAMGEPQTLLDHFGAVYGSYVIESIEETGSELDMLGQPQRIDFAIALAAYGEDAAPPAVAASDVAAHADTPMQPDAAPDTTTNTPTATAP